MIAARKGSPIVLELVRMNFLLLQMQHQLLNTLKMLFILNDDEVAIISDGKLTMKTIENQIKIPYVQELEMKLESIEKGGYEHFMLKEIYEQPRSIWDSMRGRLDAKNGRFVIRWISEL